MQTEAFAPPINIVEQFHSLHDAIASDQHGDHTRELIAYFRESERKAQELQLRTGDYEEKQFAGQLQDAYAASIRIVMAAWEKSHGVELHA
jgi:ribosomal protein S4